MFVLLHFIFAFRLRISFTHHLSCILGVFPSSLKVVFYFIFPIKVSLHIFNHSKYCTILELKPWFISYSIRENLSFC